MNLRFIEWIWHIRGSLALPPGQSSDDAFSRLDPLFARSGTSHQRAADTLTFTKKDQAAQDKMAIFDGGVLRVERVPAGGSVLRWHLTSRALLFCFLAPLLFLAFAQLTIVMGKLEKPSAETAAKASDAAKKLKKSVETPMNPIDKWLGAPAPDKPKDGDKPKGGRDKKPSPTPAYVFAGIFAALYVIGRVLEAYLAKSLFRKRLLGA